MPVEGDGGIEGVMAEEGDGGQRIRPLEDDGETEGVMAEEGGGGQRNRRLEGDGGTEGGNQQGEQSDLTGPTVGKGPAWIVLPRCPPVMQRGMEEGKGDSEEHVALRCSDGTLFYVHQEVCAQSCPEFGAMLDASTSMMEGPNRVVRMPSYASPATVRCFREWMYLGQLLILCPLQCSCCGRCVDSLYWLLWLMG